MESVGRLSAGLCTSQVVSAPTSAGGRHQPLSGGRQPGPRLQQTQSRPQLAQSQLPGDCGGRLHTKLHYERNIAVLELGEWGVPSRREEDLPLQ